MPATLVALAGVGIAIGLHRYGLQIDAHGISKMTMLGRRRFMAWDSVREIAFLMVHGLLHLAGHADHYPASRRKMLALQGKLIRNIAPRFAPPE